jgi:hypothetical protein
MAWQSYGLDRKAQALVLAAKQRDEDSLNQSYKMRMATAYGLERFWGEHVRFKAKAQDESKAKYWKATWDALVEVMAQAGVTLPNDDVDTGNPRAIEAMSEKLWAIDVKDQRVALSVLTQLCDCIVWWNQRYKG